MKKTRNKAVPHTAAPVWRGLYVETVQFFAAVRRDPEPLYVFAGLLIIEWAASELAGTGGSWPVTLALGLVQLLLLSAYTLAITRHTRLDIPFMKALGAAWYVRVLLAFAILPLLLSLASLPFTLSLEASALTALISVAVLLYVLFILVWFGVAPFFAAQQAERIVWPWKAYRDTWRLRQVTASGSWILVILLLGTMWAIAGLADIAGMYSSLAQDIVNQVLNGLLLLTVFGLASRLAFTLRSKL